MAKGKNVLTTGEVAKICSVAPRTVSKWFDSGQLKGYRIPGSKDRRIPIDELVRFMRLHNMPTTGLVSDKIRVLIVDSDEQEAMEVAEALNGAGQYETQTVHTTFDTGLVTHRFNPHVMIIQFMSQGIDVDSICTAIRADANLSTMKIFAAASHLNEHECSALLQKGFDDCISDLRNIAELAHKIEHNLAIIY